MGALDLEIALELGLGLEEDLLLTSNLLVELGGLREGMREEDDEKDGNRNEKGGEKE